MQLTNQDVAILKRVARDNQPMTQVNYIDPTPQARVSDDELIDSDIAKRAEAKRRSEETQRELLAKVKPFLRKGETLIAFISRSQLSPAEISLLNRSEIQSRLARVEEQTTWQGISEPKQNLKLPPPKSFLKRGFSALIRG